MPLPPFVIPRFNPREIPGLQAWYDAADSASITLDAGRVSQWSDKSGNARHATNTTSGSTQPSYTTAGRNGLNVLTFAAASVQRLTVAGTGTFNFLHNGTDSFIAAVSVYGTSSDPNTAYSLFGNAGGASSNTGVTVFFDDRAVVPRSNAFGAWISNGSGFYSATPMLQDTLTPQALTVQEVLFDADNTTAADRSRASINGGAYQGNNTLTTAPSLANASAAMQFGSSGFGTFPLQGDICELLFFNQQPTAAARDLIRRYLGSKWGVTVG